MVWRVTRRSWPLRREVGGEELKEIVDGEGMMRAVWADMTVLRWEKVWRTETGWSGGHYRPHLPSPTCHRTRDNWNNNTKWKMERFGILSKTKNNPNWIWFLWTNYSYDSTPKSELNLRGNICLILLFWTMKKFKQLFQLCFQTVNLNWENSWIIFKTLNGKVGYQIIVICFRAFHKLL